MSEPAPPRTSPKQFWKLLLLLPLFGLIYPPLYARVSPMLFGFPFFYWYQFAWVVVASAIMYMVYLKIRR